MPARGKSGDTYTGYASMEVTDISHIRLLFTHAAMCIQCLSFTISE